MGVVSRGLGLRPGSWMPLGSWAEGGGGVRWNEALEGQP